MKNRKLRLSKEQLKVLTPTVKVLTPAEMVGIVGGDTVSCTTCTAPGSALGCDTNK